MFLRYSGCIWKMPCVPPLQAAGDQEPSGDSQGGVLRGTPLTRGSLLPPATPPCIPEKHAGFDSII